MPDIHHNPPDYHGDVWVREERKPNGELRHDVTRHETERARDGFSEYDWWNFDQFIAEIIARAALKFVKDGHGFFEELGEEGTAQYFRDIAEPLMRYAEDKAEDTPEEQCVSDEAKKAMMRFAEQFQRWWD